MRTRREIRSTRVAACLLLLLLTVAVVAVSWHTKMMSITTSLPPLPNIPSDDELSLHITYTGSDNDVRDAILEADKKYDIDRGFIDFCANNDAISPDGDFFTLCRRYLDSVGYRDEMWETLTGYTFSVLYDIYTGRIDSENVTVLGDLYAHRKTTLAFTGDVNLSYDWYNMEHFRDAGGKVENVVSADLLDIMRSADLLLVNNEFSISDRGSPLNGKRYTFRARPDDLSIFAELGVDIVSLANNHVYDYGPDAFSDTLSHLDDAGILRIGAGMDEAEASAVRYVISGGMKIAFCAASSAEINRFTPVAGEDTPGVMGLYETDAFCRVVSEAKANADLVIAYVHFGTENSNKINDTQRAAAHAIVDAGADIIIGAHPHVLQPIEYYDGCPIVYSLGNFWFNTTTLDTAILTVSTSVGIRPVVRFYPCIQSGGNVALAGEADSARIIAMMNSWSDSADINDDNRVRER